MKYFLILTFLSVLSFLFAGWFSNDWRADNKPNTHFHYGDNVRIKTGFYEDYTCIVLDEYLKYDSLNCKIHGVVGPKGEQEILGRYEKNIEVRRSDVELMK